MNDYQFSVIMFLVDSDLNLTKKMEDECNRILSVLNQEKFPSAAFVGNVIDLVQDIKSHKGLIDSLRREILKVKGRTLVKKRNQEEVGPATPAPTTSNALRSEGADKTPVPQNQNTQAQRQVAARGNVLQKGQMTVMVLKATQPFEYESPDKGKNKMFHATVVSKAQFFQTFQVKVFDIDLKDKFVKLKIITISDYMECNGILEINEASSVSEVGLAPKLEVPNSLLRQANKTPKIDYLLQQASGIIVYGLFTLRKKTVKRKITIYEIQDNTGSIEVVGNGKWYNIKCEEGDKLQLYCFQMRIIDYKRRLVCGIHSFIKVIKTKKNKKESMNFN
ncbi:myeloid cell nuclear differentiation antigen-like isoform X2 [Microcebus murinus]|uniref:myeloid cell nuclear differentiation antigen-like isoform X2 n=1 Tax=Microcebus murinus TaxID=30608 RepID=UPI000643D53C|nr:myeloid cell nuclear differentiation antigen-like isoform X2 [Microcebus murinus]